MKVNLNVLESSYMTILEPVLMFLVFVYLVPLTKFPNIQLKLHLLETFTYPSHPHWLSSLLNSKSSCHLYQLMLSLNFIFFSLFIKLIISFR